MTAPVVLAHLEGDDAAGLPLYRCVACDRALATSCLCAGCTHPALPLPRPVVESARSTPRPRVPLGLAWLCLLDLRRAAAPAEVGRHIGVSAERMSTSLYRASRAKRPRFARVAPGLYVALARGSS